MVGTRDEPGRVKQRPRDETGLVKVCLRAEDEEGESPGEL